MNEYIMSILRLYDEYENQDELRWYFKDGKPVFFVNCSDLFVWGCADGEDILPDDLPAMKQAHDDCVAADSLCSHYGPWLFAARKCKMRPQTCILKKMPDAIRPLFEACGPFREVGFGNGG